jgi:hypothetical protein
MLWYTGSENDARCLGLFLWRKLLNVELDSPTVLTVTCVYCEDFHLSSLLDDVVSKSDYKASNASRIPPPPRSATRNIQKENFLENVRASASHKPADLHSLHGDNFALLLLIFSYIFMCVHVLCYTYILSGTR